MQPPRGSAGDRALRGAHNPRRPISTKDEQAYEQPPGFQAAARRAHSSGETSSIRVASPHVCPKGSTTLPYLSPQNMLLSGIFTVHPAEIARSNALSTSAT